MEKVITIPALGDNYIYLCQYSPTQAFIVDPGDAAPVLKAIQQNQLTITHILITHNHYDHTAGAKTISKKTGAINYPPLKPNTFLVSPPIHSAGPPSAKNLPNTIQLDNTIVRTIKTPGHTSSSVCYYTESTDNSPPLLFTGDTLFIAGCGRRSTDPKTMYDSLCKLAALPDDTLVYPGHDYTQENYEFALTILPGDEKIKNCLASLISRQKQNLPFAPSTIAREKQTNVFLRADSPEIRSALRLPHEPAHKIFAELRRRKDIFG
jgi:hydroxyacylglutathione hydrolase